MGGRQYLLAWSLALAFFAVATVVINVGVDPYLVFGTRRVPGLNSMKPAALQHEGLAKVYAFSRSQPRSIIFGSSRVDTGLDANYAHWPSELQPVYNFGMAGVGISGLRFYIAHALATKSPRLIVLGLDFESFLFVPGHDDEPKPPAENRLAISLDGRPNPGLFRRQILDVVGAAFSLDALGDSVSTVIANLSSESVDLTPSGNVTDEGFRKGVREEGQSNFFAQKDYEFFRKYASPHLSLFTDAGESFEMRELRAIVDLCRTKGVRAILFIQPMHVDRLEGLDLLGYWQQFEEWKRALVAILADLDAGEKSPSISLWDFSGFSVFSQEAVPVAGDRRTRLKWFWEPSHYTRDLGNEILARIFDVEDAGFGVLLTSDSLEIDLSTIREARARFRATDTQTAARLNALLNAR